MLNPDAEMRWRAARPFVLLGGTAIIAGGLLAAVVGLPGAAATANLPLRHLAWASAYLVLIVGVAQIVFGAGQAWLPARVPAAGWVAGEWIVFNLGNAGVIAGTLFGSFALVCVGTLLFAAGIALFLLGARGARRGGWLVGFRVLLGLIFVSSLIGLALSVQPR
ncbi:MAG: hypothetical protein ACREPH_01260 [Rhodanobacteraceae bacterium]